MNGQHILGGRKVDVPLDVFDDEPGPYTMSFAFDLQPLWESIKTIGLVNPPCIAEDEKGRIEVISGYRRILALKRIGRSAILCEDLSSALPSAKERLLFAFFENLGTRDFNDAEKAMILKRLKPLFPEEHILKRFMPLLSLPCHEEAFTLYLTLAAKGDAFMDAVARGRLCLKAAKSLMELNHESEACAFQCIMDLMLNVNQQMQFIDIMIDISEIEGSSFSRILKAAPVAAVLKSRRLNRPQKARRLLEELRRQRYPRWMAAEKRFQKKVEELHLPGGVRMDHPPYFEAPGYRLEMPFLDGGDLMKKLRQLSENRGLAAFQNPVDEDD